MEDDVKVYEVGDIIKKGDMNSEKIEIDINNLQKNHTVTVYYTKCGCVKNLVKYYLPTDEAKYEFFDDIRNQIMVDGEVKLYKEVDKRTYTRVNMENIEKTYLYDKNFRFCFDWNPEQIVKNIFDLDKTYEHVIKEGVRTK